MGQFDVTGPDKKTYRVTVPEGATEQQAIEFVQHKYYGGAGGGGSDQPITEPAPPEMGFFERLGSGIRDPFQGAAQWLEHVMPGATYLDSMNNWLADQGLPLAKVDIDPNAGWVGSHGLDRQTREREAQIQAATPKGAELPIIGDPARFAGNLLSPATWAFTPAKLGVIGAATVGAGLQPVTQDTDNFGYEKAQQLIEGALTGTIFKGTGKVIGKGFEALMTRLTREFPDAMITQAAQEVIKRVATAKETNANGPGMVDLMKLVNEAHARGQPMTLADVATMADAGSSKGLRALFGNLQRSGGKAQAMIMKALLDRDARAGDRIFNAIAKYIHGGDVTAYKTAKTLLNVRSEIGKPLWDEANRLENIWSPWLERMYRNPDARAGLQRGYRILRNEADANNEPFDPTQQRILRQDGNEIVVEQGVAPNMRVLQMVKQGLDELIDENINKETGRLNKTGVSQVKLRDAFVREIKRLDHTGNYARALDAWAGETANFDALNMGKGIFTMSRDEVSETFGHLTPGEREFFLLGVADRMRERVAKAGWAADEAKKIFNNEWTKDLLRPIFRNDKEASEFLDTILPSETVMHAVKAEAASGSATAERVAEDARAQAAQLLDLGLSAVHGHWHSVLRNLFHIFRKMGVKPDDKLNEMTAKLMLQTQFLPGDRATQALLGQLPRSAGDRGREAVNRIASSRAAGVAGGAAAGAPSDLPIEMWHGLQYRRTPDGRLIMVPGQSLTNYTPPVQ